jgi:glycosyltransferase involved in cell wall biosynthesis
MNGTEPQTAVEPRRTPALSIVVPNYNHGRLIGEALGAIAGQTMAPFEVIVIDDGSTDDSVARIRELTGDMPLQLHCHPRNRGVVAAMNTGLSLVKGDFVLFSAADDRLAERTVELAAAAAAEFPATGIIFSDHAEMSADGSDSRVMPLDMPGARHHFSSHDFIALMQRSFFGFHVSSVWFNVELLRALGGFRAELRWHCDLFVTYAAAFDRGATYVPGAVSYFRQLPTSYGTSGTRSDAQVDVLRAWLAATREPGWEATRAAFVTAAILPEYSLRAMRALQFDPGYLSFRLLRRLVWLSFWMKVAPFVGTRVRAWMRGIRSRYRKSRLVRAERD